MEIKITSPDGQVINIRKAHGVTTMCNKASPEVCSVIPNAKENILRHMAHMLWEEGWSVDVKR